MSDITNPHDAFFKQFMTKPEIAADFLTQHLPVDVLTLLDLTTLDALQVIHLTDFTVRLEQRLAALPGMHTPPPTSQ